MAFLQPRSLWKSKCFFSSGHCESENVFPAPVIVKVKVFLSMFSKFCPYFFLKNCLTFFHTFFHLFCNLLQTHIHLQYKININTFLGTFVHEIWQSIWWINLSYLLWLMLRSSSKCSGHCESESVSINVFRFWSNLFSSKIV